MLCFQAHSSMSIGTGVSMLNNVYFLNCILQLFCLIIFDMFVFQAHSNMSIRDEWLFNILQYTGFRATIRAPCTKYFLEIPETHRKHFQTTGEVLAHPWMEHQWPKIRAKLSKYMGGRDVNISVSIRAPCTKFL